MEKVGIATAKAHLRASGNEEDALIGALIDAAYRAIQGQLFRKVYDAGAVIDAADTTGIYTNATINSAALLIVGHLYASREAVTSNMAALPMGVDWLLAPDVNCAGGA